LLEALVAQQVVEMVLVLAVAVVVLALLELLHLAVKQATVEMG
jgi:hypothetical protein